MRPGRHDHKTRQLAMHRSIQAIGKIAVVNQFDVANPVHACSVCVCVCVCVSVSLSVPKDISSIDAKARAGC